MSNKLVLTENRRAKYKYCTLNKYLSKCTALNPITEHQERMIGSSECGLHVPIAALLEKNTDVANIRILSPSGLFHCPDFLFTQSEMYVSV